MKIKGFFDDRKVQINHHQVTINNAREIHIKLDGPFEHCPIIIRDSTQRLRALLTFKTRIKEYILATSPEAASNLTIPGPLPSGKWTIDIMRACPIKGFYEIDITVKENNCLALAPQKTKQNQKYDEYNIEQVKLFNHAQVHELDNKFESDYPKAQMRIFRGDLHLHSHYSDGRISPEEIVSAAKNNMLDFISITDHSLCQTNYPIGILMLPGTEITWDNEGHYNIWGVDNLIDFSQFLSVGINKNQALNNMFHHIKKLYPYACISINHPFPFDWEMQHDFNIDNIDCIEVINSPHLTKPEVDNEKACKFFDYLWDKNILLMAVGGSDAHKKNYFCTTEQLNSLDTGQYAIYPVGIPTNNIYCYQLKTRHILHSLRSGHNFLTVRHNIECNFTDENNQYILPGTYIQGKVKISAKSKELVEWHLIRNGKIIDCQRGAKYMHVINVLYDEFYRLEAYDSNGLCFFANPLHAKERSYTDCNYQKLLREFLRRNIN